MALATTRDLAATRAALEGWLTKRLPGGSAASDVPVSDVPVSDVPASDVVVSDLESPSGTGFSNETLLFDATWSAAACSGSSPTRGSWVTRST
jgi:hypothetical protein